MDCRKLIKPKFENLRDSKNNSSSIVHVSTYSSNLHNNDSLINDFFHLLTENISTGEYFRDKRLILSKRQPQNLKSLLTGAQIKGIESGGVFKCNSARLLCKIIITGNSLIFHLNNFYFTIKCNMTCNCKNCLYVIECQGCKQMYIGETNNFRLRTNLHRDHASKNIGLCVSRHIFSCTNRTHSEKFRIMPFYKMSTDDPVKRRFMEAYFIKNEHLINKWPAV